MKKYLLCGLLMVSFNLCFSQNKVDTIFTNTKVKTYIIFPDFVDWVDPGIDKYESWYQGNSVGFFALEKDLPPALLIIKYGNNFWHGTIAYKANIPIEETMINLSMTDNSEISAMVNKERVKVDSGASITDLVVKRRLGVLEGNNREEEKNYGIADSKLLWKVSILRKDENYYYLKCGLFNRSKEDYVVETIDFEYSDTDPVTDLPITDYKSPRDHYSSKTPLESGFAKVNVNTKEVVYFLAAIPLVSMSKKGKLKITIWESQGTRSLSFSIPVDALINVKQF